LVDSHAQANRPQAVAWPVLHRWCPEWCWATATVKTKQQPLLSVCRRGVPSSTRERTHIVHSSCGFVALNTQPNTRRGQLPQRLATRTAKQGTMVIHQCEQCAFKSANKSALDVHSRTHTGEKVGHPSHPTLIPKDFISTAQFNPPGSAWAGGSWLRLTISHRDTWWPWPHDCNDACGISRGRFGRVATLVVHFLCVKSPCVCVP